MRPGWLAARFSYPMQMQSKGIKMKKIRSVRVSDSLWVKVQAKAKEEERSVSEVIVEHLREYVKAWKTKKNPYTGKVAV